MSFETEAVVQRLFLTLSWRRPLSYRNQSIDVPSKSMDWFLYDNGLRHERVKGDLKYFAKFTGKHLCQASSLIPVQVFSFEFCKIVKNTYF